MGRNASKQQELHIKKEEEDVRKDGWVDRVEYNVFNSWIHTRYSRWKEREIWIYNHTVYTNTI